MEKWFPANPASRLGASANHTPPRARILCFHGAGSDSTMFTSTGTARRPLPNPLMTYCLENDIQLLTVHLPGRTQRLKEPFMTSATGIAGTVLDLLMPMLSRPKTPNETQFELTDDIPLIIIGHSMGSIIAYEFVCLMRQKSMPLPRHLLLSCMMSPDVPKDKRPWTPAAELSTEELKQACRLWGINEEVFSESMWEMYEPILRADFQVLDDYSFADKMHSSLTSVSSSTTSSPASSPCAGKCAVSYHAPLGISTTVFYAEKDTRITKEVVEGWEKIAVGSNLFSTSPSGFGTVTNTSAQFKVESIPGTHNFFYESEGRTRWMEITSQVADKLLIDLEYGF